jgi:surfeit locus 1 family protein
VTRSTETVTAPVDGAALEPDPREPRPRMPFAEFLAIARRPLWIGALVLVLGVAAAFAALAQWQVGRSVESAQVEERATETVVPLDRLAGTAEQVRGDQEGQLVEIEASYVPGDSTVLSGRLNDGELGWWAVAHAVTSDGDSLAVALGWASTPEAAAEAGDRVTDADGVVTGRFLGSEAPQDQDFEAGERSALAVAELVNLWAEPGPVYGGYVVSAEAPAGLETISAPPPEQQVQLNWLNVFYAVEWIIFAGFGFYLWYRLVKDVWEREREEAEVSSA